MIEYKHSEDISVYFTPIENGKNEYYLEVHNFSNLDCWRDQVDGIELTSILSHPDDVFNGFRY